jgi:hypothetical protein
VPVVASKSGGPQELLPQEWIYPVGDLEACVNSVVAILLNPLKATALMHAQRFKLADQLNREQQLSSLTHWWSAQSAS